MAWYADTLWCDGCGVEIRWAPIETGDYAYCCKKCLEGERCECSEIPEDYPPSSNIQDQDFTLINN